MDREQVLKWAREAGLPGHPLYGDEGNLVAQTEFARIVRNAALEEAKQEAMEANRFYRDEKEGHILMGAAARYIAERIEALKCAESS